MIQLCGTKNFIFGTKIHFRCHFDSHKPNYFASNWVVYGPKDSQAILLGFSNLIWLRFLSFLANKKNQWKWRYLDFWQPVVTYFYDFGNFCQNWSIGITPGLGMLPNHDANDAYLDKDNFIRTRKCEIIFGREN